MAYNGKMNCIFHTLLNAAAVAAAVIQIKWVNKSMRFFRRVSQEESNTNCVELRRWDIGLQIGRTLESLYCPKKHETQSGLSSSSAHSVHHQGPTP